MAVDTYDCDVRVGCMLLEKQQGDSVKPIGYWSRSNDVERGCDTTNRECLAIVLFVFIVCPYCEGTCVEV